MLANRLARTLYLKNLIKNMGKAGGYPSSTAACNTFQPSLLQISNSFRAWDSLSSLRVAFRCYRSCYLIALKILCLS